MMHINYVLDFTRAPVERWCYMKILKVVELHSDTEWVLKVNNNIFGQWQTEKLWNKFLVGKLISLLSGIRQSNIYGCMFYLG